MQWSRVKTILIITLLLVDGFLIAMLGGKALFVYQRQQEMRQHVEMILLKNGITLASSMKIPRSAPMPQLRVDRSRADEAALANALLGGDATRREEGEESHFESTSGEVVWNERGEIHARLTPEGYSMPETKQVGARAAQIFFNHRARTLVHIDKIRTCRAARQRFDAELPRAREQIEHARRAEFAGGGSVYAGCGLEDRGRHCDRLCAAGRL